jgi:hypothetical protein
VRTARILKEQLINAQSSLKKIDDKKRIRMKFHVGDWVYFTVQPYRQITIQGRPGTHKLAPKFFGPFEVVKRIDKVAYELNLPSKSMCFMSHNLREI